MNIVFHDVDGCLNANANTPIPTSNEPMPQLQVGRLNELGKAIDSSSIDHFVINTGRSVEDTLPVAEAINSQKLQYIVCEHGAVYYDFWQNKPVVVSGAIAEKLKQIQDFIRWYRDNGASILNQRLGTDIPILNKVANLTLDARNRMDTRLVHDELRGLVMNESPFDHRQLIFHHSSADGYVDVMSQIDKGDGIKVITSLLSGDKGADKRAGENPPDEICSIAIGNGLNDMPMLEAATIAVCPQNSEPEVQAYCRARSGVVSEQSYIDATLQWLEGHR